MLLCAKLDLAFVLSSVWVGVRLDAKVSEFIVALWAACGSESGFARVGWINLDVAFCSMNC